jgi:outer membrane protein, heavy metal efflux system
MSSVAKANWCNGSEGRIRRGALLSSLLLVLCADAAASESIALSQVPALARAQRSEVVAAQALAAAAHRRPAIVAALEDPMIMPSIDHYPFETMMDEGGDGRRYDWSVSVEQRFPLSGIRGHRRRVAQADAQRFDAQAERAALDVELEAVDAFLMLHEHREMRRIADTQLALARQLTAAANARYAAGSGAQSDLLRAEVEIARVEAQIRALDARIRGAEAMFNAAIGRDVQTPVPTLLNPVRAGAVPATEQVLAAALQHRPELRAGDAELQRAQAEIDVMRAMYRPMAVVRGGYATTMAEGEGAMLMVGVSLPIWRGALRAGVGEARAMETMARADLAAMRRMVEGEAAAARENVESARAHYLAVRDDVLPRAQMAVDSALAGYRAGQAGMTGVTEALRLLWSMQAEQLMAETALGQARARLDRAMGTFGETAP